MSATAQIRFHLQCLAWQVKAGRWERVGFHLEGFARGVWTLMRS